MAQLLHLLYVVARVDDGGAALVEAPDALKDGAAGLGVDGDGGLVEDDELGGVGDAAGDIEPAQQAAGELLGPEVRELLQVDEGDRRLDQAAAPGAFLSIKSLIPIFSKASFVFCFNSSRGIPKFSPTKATSSSAMVAKN